MIALSAASLIACAGPEPGPDSGTPADAGGDAGVSVPSFHCAPGPSCPELVIEGDAPTTWPAHPFHGLGDPSLEAHGGAVWLSYSWLDTSVTPPGDRVDFRVATHLARSDDGGRTFRFVRAVNVPDRRLHWDDATRDGFLEHEVSTLVRRADDFELVWLTYFDALGEASANRSDIFLESTVAATGEALGDVVTPVLRGSLTTASVGGLNGSTLAGLEDCGIFTEPGLVTAAGVTYLAASCLSFEGFTRRADRDRSVLFREAAGGLELVGTLLAATDAARLGGDRFEQLDFSTARDGTMLLIGTPILDGSDPAHRGCVVLEVEDLARAAVRREPDGAPHERYRLTAEGNGLGPGLCTYDAASETGVLMVSTRFDGASTPPRLAFTLHSTFVHP